MMTKSSNIDLAKKEIKRYRINSAIEYLHFATEIISNRIVISVMNDDSHFINSLRTVNIVLANCTAYLAEMVKQDYDVEQMNVILEELEMIDNLNFLSEAYKGLIKIKNDSGENDDRRKTFRYSLIGNVVDRRKTPNALSKYGEEVFMVADKLDAALVRIKFKTNNNIAMQIN